MDNKRGTLTYGVETYSKIKNNLKDFVKIHKDDSDEKSQSTEYWIDFFKCFNLNTRDIGKFEYSIKNIYDSKTYFIDFLWEKKLLIEHKSRKGNLKKAFKQAMDYFDMLNRDIQPRYIIVSNFQKIIVTDLITDTKIPLNIEDLPDNINLFRFILQENQQYFSQEKNLTIEASNILTEFHKELLKVGYNQHDLAVFLTRVLFCLYSEDTEIFNENSFYQYIRNETDHRRLGLRINQLFSVLDEDYEQRNPLNEEMFKGINEFPYVNGALFKENIVPPPFNEELYNDLIKSCNFNWTPISPAIFGSLFQEIMDDKIKHDEGTHYTSEENVLKVINLLFMNDLREEFNQAKYNTKKLERLHDKISKLKFFDPACGCGNFLIVTYQQLRLLEMDIIEALTDKAQLSFTSKSKIKLSNFYGIEKQELPARISKVAMWLMEHKMDLEAEHRFEIHKDNLPLKDSANIIHGNALTMEWEEVVTPNNSVYILGNPPFISSKTQSKEQKIELKEVFKTYKNISSLDYVTAWFKKATDFIQGTKIQVGFISTNSICQGKQASILWKILMENNGISINFAHQSFKWDSDVKKKAAVYVIIVGFGVVETPKKYIYKYNLGNKVPIQKEVKKINNYLHESENIFLNIQRGFPVAGS